MCKRNSLNWLETCGMVRFHPPSRIPPWWMWSQAVWNDGVLKLNGWSSAQDQPPCWKRVVTVWREQVIPSPYNETHHITLAPRTLYPDKSHTGCFRIDNKVPCATHQCGRFHSVDSISTWLVVGWIAWDARLQDLNSTGFGKSSSNTGSTALFSVLQPSRDGTTPAGNANLHFVYCAKGQAMSAQTLFYALRCEIKAIGNNVRVVTWTSNCEVEHAFQLVIDNTLGERWTSRRSVTA